MKFVTAELFFRLDETSGRLYWREVSKYHNEKRGQEAGSAAPHHTGKRYWVVSLMGKKYKRSKLVYLLTHGVWLDLIDHINGDSLDDRPCNLRPATALQNSQNRKVGKPMRDLPMGVRSLKSGRFGARITLDKKQLHLGSYVTVQDAEKAYIAKRKELFHEFA